MRGRTMNLLIRLKRLFFVVLVLTCVGLGLPTTVFGGTNVIYSFAGDEDGEYADTDLAIDKAGNLYGTTVLGGDFGGGTVFQLSPSGNDWVHTVLYSFTGGPDGGEPYKGVTLDAQGNLYGMAPTGGANGLGTIYQIHPDGNSWTLNVIHTFTGGSDGASGSAGQMLLRGGLLYGAATAGGIYGKGTVFELKPTQSGEWIFRTIYSFRGQPDAGFPYGGLLFDTAGHLFGTTYYDGAYNLGAVYELFPRPAGEWNERVLYSFQGGSDGQNSISNLVFDVAGNLYGTTSEGGLGSGVVFGLTPTANARWREIVPHQFQGPPDAPFAYNGMVADGLGNFYGATVHGGTDGEGAIYKFTPNQKSRDDAGMSLRNEAHKD